MLGALGLAGTATYFIEKWFSLGSLVPFFPAEPESRGQVGPAARLPRRSALVFVLLGILVERGRRPARLAGEPARPSTSDRPTMAP